MFKRGQVTAFLIIGAILLIVSGLVLFMQSDYYKSVFQAQQAGLKSVPVQAQPLADFITLCVESAGRNALIYTGARGWTYTPATEVDLNQLPYFIVNDKKQMPSKEKIASELAAFVDYNLPACASLLQSDQFQIKLGKPNTTVIITSNTVMYDVNYPVEFTMGNFTTTLDRFQGTVNFNIDRVYDGASAYLDEQAKNDEGLCLSCMFNVGTNKTMYFQYYTVSDIEDEITIKDYKSLINNQPYLLTFAVKHKKL